MKCNIIHETLWNEDLKDNNDRKHGPKYSVLPPASQKSDY